jgi:RimJ/RimL family protein N-acetyltransferase
MGYYWQGVLVRLRELRPEDAELWLAEDQDSEAIRTLNYQMQLPASTVQAAEFAERYAYFKSKGERTMFSIEKLDGTLVGGINIHTVSHQNGTFQTGSRVYRPFRGQGYGLEAKLIVLRYCFHELRLNKYYCKCLETNEGIIKHLERLGCAREGVFREQIYTEGRFYSELFFGLTRRDFEENYPRLIEWLREKVGSGR